LAASWPLVTVPVPDSGTEVLPEAPEDERDLFDMLALTLKTKLPVIVPADGGAKLAL
jgi:hypothetical protein